MDNFLVNMKHKQGDDDGDILDATIVEADSKKSAESQGLAVFGDDWEVIGSRKLVTGVPAEASE